MKIEHAYWLAAAIDGEGCIILRKKRNRWHLSIAIANDSLEFLDFAFEICGGGRIYAGKRCLQFRIENSAECIRVLEQIEPYLLIKRRKALHSIETMRSQGPPPAQPRINGRFVSRASMQAVKAA
jgi:hypothetical protein